MTYNPKSAKTPLGSLMSPSSQALYPPSDVTSYTTSTSQPAYSGQYGLAFNDPNAALRWRYAGNWFNLSNNGVNAINGATTSVNSSWTSWEIEFYLNGTDVTIWSVSLGATDYRIYVDDMPLTMDWQLTPSGTTSNYIKIQFATSRVRRIRFFGSGLMSFTGILLPGASDIWAAPPRYRAAIIGDSYIQGGHDAGVEGYLSAAGLSNQIAILTGWEVVNLGQGSTGYTNNGGGAGGKDIYGATSRINALSAISNVDLIIPYGSGNDSGVAASTLTAAVNSHWGAIKTAKPNAAIVVAGMEPGSPTGFNPSLLDGSNSDIKNAAAANAHIDGFIDMRPSVNPWVTGTGNAGAPNDSGSADFFISSDQVHPTRAGYFNMATRMVSELRKIRV